MDQAMYLPHGWLSGEGPASAIILSSRLRAARNLADFPFPYRASEATRREILGKVAEAVGRDESLRVMEFVDLESLHPMDRQILVENHLTSPYHIQDPRGRGLLKQEDATLSVMINEEDHLRLQCIQSGLNLEKGWDILNQLDDTLETHLPYAFHEQWGYLVACPTNLGTGLRASVLLHLPALTFLQSMPNLIHQLNQMGLVVRGFYGEGTEAQGHFYQMSNAFSLGPTEEDLVARVSFVARQVMDQEVQGRDRIKREQPSVLEDRLWRAFAILKSARIINSVEAMEQLSLTRLGVQLGLLPPIPVRILNEVLFMTRPGNLQKHFGVEPDPVRRDILRANYLRKTLENV